MFSTASFPFERESAILQTLRNHLLSCNEFLLNSPSPKTNSKKYTQFFNHTPIAPQKLISNLQILKI